MAHNLARWVAQLGLGAGILSTKRLRRRLFAIVSRLTRSARRLTLHLPAPGRGSLTSPMPWLGCAPSRA